MVSHWMMNFGIDHQDQGIAVLSKSATFGSKITVFATSIILHSQYNASDPWNTKNRCQEEQRDQRSDQPLWFYISVGRF